MTMIPLRDRRSTLDPKVDSKDDARPGIRLVFQGRQGREGQKGLFLLARAFGLDVWGDYLLNRRAVKEMGSAALLLVGVLAFELLAWSMLFNVLVHSADWRISLRTIPALLLGGIFSAGIFLFEKSFITSDFRDAALQKTLAYGIRLLIPAGSRLLVEKPIYDDFVAELDEQVIGQLMITYEWSDWRNGTVLWIQSVYVLPEQRGRGVYRALWEHLRERVEASPDLHGLRLYVDKRNTAAQRVYTRLGMTREHYDLFEWLKE